MKRSIATITVFVYGENEQEQFDEAKKMAKKLNDNFDCNASVEKLHSAPFGSYGQGITEINLEKLEK